MTNYVLGEKIGHGGMGLVYKARDTGLDKDVAIKFMDEALAHDAQCVERFFREARMLAKIDHPNVVRVMLLGTWPDGRPYFVMELLDGIPLNERLKRGALPEGEAAEIAAQALSGLQEAHNNGVYHRDVKSSNILLCSGARVKVIDFGIARDDMGASVTSTGKIIGTPTYMSPEQAMGEKAGAQSDIYSMGVVLYEMLSGAVPFRSETPIAVLRMHTDVAPPALPNSISSKLRSVVAKALEKRPEKRFQSAMEMANALRAATLNATPVPKQKTKTNPRMEPVTPRPSKPISDGGGAKKILVPLLILIVIVGGVGAAWMSGAFGSGSQETLKAKEPDIIPDFGGGTSTPGSGSSDSGTATSTSTTEVRRTVEETEDAPIAFKVTTQNAPTLSKGVRKTAREGQNGLKRTTYEAVYVGDKRMSRTMTGEQTVREPVDKVVLVGTKSITPVKPKPDVNRVDVRRDPKPPKTRYCGNCGAVMRGSHCGQCGWP